MKAQRNNGDGKVAATDMAAAFLFILTVYIIFIIWSSANGVMDDGVILVA